MSISVDGSMIKRCHWGSAWGLFEHNGELYGIIDDKLQKYDPKSSQLTVVFSPQNEKESIETYCFGSGCIFVFVNEDISTRKNYRNDQCHIYKITDDGANPAIIFDVPKNYELLYDWGRVLANSAYRNGRLYYIASNKISYQNSMFSINLDGSDNKKEFNYTGNAANGMLIMDDRVYISSGYDGFFSCDLDYSNKMSIFDKTESFCMLDNTIVFVEEEIIYMDGANYVYGKTLHCINGKNGDKVYFDNYCDLIGICGNWIYFYDRGENIENMQWKLCRIRLDGTGLMELPEVY